MRNVDPASLDRQVKLLESMGLPHERQADRIVVRGDITLSTFAVPYEDRKKLTELPDLRDVYLIGNFACIGAGLKTLDGAPFFVSRNFSCLNNDLSTLAGSPEEVGDDFNCAMNKLKNLRGGPEKVGGEYLCASNELVSLDGAAQRARNFCCAGNRLSTLEGGPRDVDDVYDCSDNELVSLFGAPTSPVLIFYCGKNKLASLKHVPPGNRMANSRIDCTGNAIQDLWSLRRVKSYNRIGIPFPGFDKDFFCPDEIKQKLKEIPERVAALHAKREAAFNHAALYGSKKKSKKTRALRWSLTAAPGAGA